MVSAAVPSAASAAGGVAGRVFTVAGPISGKQVASVAAMSDGGFLYVERDFDGWAIRRVLPTGAISTIAQGFSVPIVTEVTAVVSDKLAVLPSGGVLFADIGFARVFAASLDGTLTRSPARGCLAHPVMAVLPWLRA